MSTRAIGLPSDLSLPGVDFASILRRLAAERRDLDRAATPRQREAIAIVRRARVESDVESSRTLAALSARTRPTTHLRTIPRTATPQPPNTAAQNLLGLAIFVAFVGIISAGIHVLTRESVIATPLRDSRDVVEGRR